MSTLAPPPYARAVPPRSAPHVPAEYSLSIPPNVKTIPVLQEVFEVLQHGWIREFLFTPDPIQVSILTSLNAAYAVNVVFRESSIGRSLTSTDPFSAYVDGETVLVPAFTNGPYSAGIGIKKRTSDIPKDAKLVPWTGHLTTEHLRFVADTTTGTYFVIRHSRNLPYVFIEVFALLSAVHRKRTVLTFHVSKLYDMINRYEFKSFPYVVHNALAMVQCITETRECNTCGSVLDPTCRCPLISFKADHPLDFEAMKKNLNSHFGAFQGFETLNVYTAGAQIASAELGARFSVTLGTDPKRTRDLIYWAINDRMVAECPGPLRHLHTVCDSEPEEIFGYFGNLDVDEEEHEPVKQYFIEDIESDSVGSKPDMVQRRARKVSPPLTSEEETRGKSSSDGLGSDPASPGTPASPKESSGGKSSLVIPRDQETTQDQEKREKKRIRIEKNRVAARKSNWSKKLKNEQIREALKASKERKDALLEKEARLRVENSQLRKLCSNP